MNFEVRSVSGDGPAEETSLIELGPSCGRNDFRDEM